MQRKLVVDGHVISDDSVPFVIAEIGHNHQGSLDKAKELILAAQECGVDAVKFQKRNNKTLYTKSLYNQPYDNENSFGMTYGEHREALEFGKTEYLELKHYAETLGVVFFATAFDFTSVNFLVEINVPAIKIASGDLSNVPLLKYVAETKRPIFLSTGGATMEDVMRAYDVISKVNDQICIMQCTASYPAEPSEVNLNVLKVYREMFPCVIGLSDHYNGIAMAPIAYVLGARVIEKHFTFNHAAKGTDHAFSLEPIGMRKMVRDLHRAKEALGDGVKRQYASESKPLFKMGKKVVASHDMKAGTEISSLDLALKSPNDGIPPYQIYGVIGKVLVRDIREDESIRWEDLA